MKPFDSTLRLLLALSLVVPFLAAGAVRPALACSGPGVPEPVERFAPGSEFVAPGTGSIALLGQVLDETELEVSFNTAYLSQVQLVVPLAGDAIEDLVRVGPNGFGAPDCSGGPRLFAGEKVMLFLYPSRGIIGGDAGPSYYGDWQSGQTGTPILFDGKDAYYLSWGRFNDQGPGGEQRFYVGESAEVLDLALAYFGVTAEQREQAFQFVLGTSAPSAPTPAPAPPTLVPTATPSPGEARISPPDTGSAGLLGAQ